MTCTLCTLGDPPGCDACLGAADEPTGEPALSIIYRIVHVPSGDWYCGKHRLAPGWSDPFEDDGYPFNDRSDARKRLARKLAKHPRSEFKKDVLAVLPTEEAALWLESGLVGPEQVANPRCLNVCEGGIGGLAHLDEETERLRRERAAEAMGRPETRARMSTTHKRLATEDPARREHLQAMQEASRTPEARKKKGASLKRDHARRTPAERRQRLSKAVQAAQASGVQAKVNRRPEKRAKQSATNKRRCAAMTDAERQEMTSKANTPEANEKKAALLRERARTPEVRRSRSDTNTAWWANATDEQKAARTASQQEGRRRAKAERARVRREVQMILAALIVNKYGGAEAA